LNRISGFIRLFTKIFTFDEAATGGKSGLFKWTPGIAGARNFLPLSGGDNNIIPPKTATADHLPAISRGPTINELFKS
jgi:hypothetical protein